MKSNKTLFSVMGAVCFALNAHASTLTFNNSIAVTETETLNGTNVISLSKFDTSLGTLNSVTLNVTLTAPSFSIIVDNDSANTANVTVTYATLGATKFSASVDTVNADLSDTINGDDFSIATQSTSFNVAGNDADSTETFENDGGVDNGIFTTTAILVGDTGHSIYSSLFDQYQSATPGTIDFEIAVDFTTDLNINSGGGSGDTRFEGTIPGSTFTAEIIYDYTAVPEVSQFALLAGLLVLGGTLVRRRR